MATEKQKCTLHTLVSRHKVKSFFNWILVALALKHIDPTDPMKQFLTETLKNEIPLLVNQRRTKEMVPFTVKRA